MHVREIRKERSGSNFFIVYYVNNWGDKTETEVFAKDELEAYTRFNEIYKKGEERMRTFLICLTFVVLTLLSSITYSGADNRSRYDTNMRDCVKAGKSYISEGDGYSCRDPFVKAVK